MNLLLRKTIFGVDLQKMTAMEVVYRSKNVLVVHIESMKRMRELFSLCGLCATVFFKTNGYKYGGSGKVDVVKDG